MNLLPGVLLGVPFGLHLIRICRPGQRGGRAKTIALPTILHLLLSSTSYVERPLPASCRTHIETSPYRSHEVFMRAVKAQESYKERLNLYTAIWNTVLAQDANSE